MDRQDIVNLVLNEMARNCQFDLSIILSDLSRGEVGILGFLAYRENDVSAGVLSEELSITSARVASILNALEKKHFVIRQKSRIDKRKTIVHITSEGKKQIQQIKTNLVSKLEYIVDEIGVEDAIVYLEITKRIKDAVQRLERGSIC